MVPTDWSDPEQRREYHRAQGAQYRKKHPRVTLTFSEQDYEWIIHSAKHYGQEPGAPYIRELALLAAKNGWGSNDEPSVPEEDVKEMLRLIRGVANNLNQIARRLNTEALEEQRRIVASKPESKEILDLAFDSLIRLESELLSRLP